MPRFYRASLALVVFFATVTLSVRMIGGTRTAALAIVFTYPDGSPCQRPCRFGIRAGETSVEEAVALLKAHPFSRDYPVRSEDPIIAGNLQTGPTILIARTRDSLV